MKKQKNAPSIESLPNPTNEEDNSNKGDATVDQCDPLDELENPKKNKEGENLEIQTNKEPKFQPIEQISPD